MYFVPFCDVYINICVYMLTISMYRRKREREHLKLVKQRPWYQNIISQQFNYCFIVSIF